jgi:hypothetical protein
MVRRTTSSRSTWAPLRARPWARGSCAKAQPGPSRFDYQLPAVARAASFCVTNLGWRLEAVSPADELHQWAVLRTSAVPDTRPFDHYVEF